MYLNISKVITTRGLQNFAYGLDPDFNYTDSVSINASNVSNYINLNGGLNLCDYYNQSTKTLVGINSGDRLLTLSNGSYVIIELIDSGNNMRLTFKLADNTQVAQYVYGVYNFAFVYIFFGRSTPDGDIKISTWGCKAPISGNGTLFRNSNFGVVMTSWFAGSIATSDPYQTAEDSENGGGYGDFDYTSDIIPLPTAPTISVSDSGFVTLYKPSLGQLQALSSYMWSGLFDIATFRKIFADPMDCIISLALLPISPAASGSQELKVGNIGTGIVVDKLPTQFVEINFNTLNIGRRANNFMDYSPYTKVQIYLPFIGTRSLSIDDIAGRNIALRYIVDLFTGACNAALGAEVETIENGQKVKRITTLYEFTGNILANVPVTADNFASFLQATIGAVSTAVGVATGAGAITGIASAINSATAMKPDIEKSGNLSSTAGFLGVQKPYLILTYPNLCKPASRDKVAGTPSFIGLDPDPNHHIKLSKFKGYTLLHKINVKGIHCTESERQMILSQLTGEGVILP